jgi:hypothetical protein
LAKTSLISHLDEATLIAVGETTQKEMIQLVLSPKMAKRRGGILDNFAKKMPM